MKKDLLKKITVIGLALTLAFAMTACGDKGTTENDDAQAQTQTEQTDGSMTAELAEQKAIEDAGLSAGDVQIMESGFEEGKYEIEFLDKGNNIEYSYEISEDGKILEKSAEYLGVDISGDPVDENAAFNTALKDAGFEESGIQGKSVTVDEGNFEIRFVDNATGDEYDYEIAPNGAILEKSVEFGKIDVSASSEAPAKEFNRDAAIAKALKAAKVSQSEVAGVEAEAEDGKFEVEFIKNSNGAEYSFEYDKSGKLLERGVDYNRAPVTGEAKLSKSDAVAKAADFLGIDREKVAAGSVYQETDDGEVVFEINFNEGSWRYDIDINGTSGKVLEWSKERI